QAHGDGDQGQCKFGAFHGISQGNRAPMILNRQEMKRAGIPALFCDARAISYLIESTHFTSVLTSASGTAAFGGIGTWPQTPCPPFFTFSTSFASASFCPAYFLATSAYVAPIVFVPLTTWQVVHMCFLARSSLARAGSAATR